MSKALSQVQVSIGGKLDPSFQQSFDRADKKQQEFAKASADLSKKVGNVDAFRAQKRALQETEAQWKSATAKVGALKKEIEATAAPTRKQQAEFNRAVREAQRASGAYNEQRERLQQLRAELQRSGVSVTKLSSEYRRLKSELEAANAKYAKHEASLRRQQAIVNGMRAAWQSIGSLATGAIAAGAVLSGPTRKALTYEEQLAYMADTAGAGKSAAEKQALQKQLSDAVESARQYSKGSSREDVATALQTLIASGKFEGGESMAVLPAVARAAFAGGANPEDIAKTAIAMKQFGIRDVGGEFDKILRAGQLGNFELKDMARWLPQQLALAKSSGYYGTQGLTDLLAFNQVAMRTAGTQDEAGNNVVNLLQKFSSREFSDSVAKAVTAQRGDPTHGGKKGKGQVFDWAGYLIQQRGQGVGAVEAFAKLMDRQLAGDKRYQDIQKKLGAAGSDDERKQLLGAMADIGLGSDLGQIIADRQALMGAMASIYGRDDMAKLRSGIGGAAGSVNQSAEFLGGQNFAKSKLLGGNLDRANESAYSAVNGTMGAVLDGLNGASQQFPKLTAAAYAATGALASIAAFVAGSAIFGKVAGGAAGGSAAGSGAAAAAGGSAAGGLLSKGRAFMTGPKGAFLGRAGAAGLAAWGGLELAELAGLPNTDAAKGKQLWDRGEYWKASAYMPAGDFLGAVWGKMTSKNTEMVEASKAAAAAAVAAAPKPNVTQTFQNSFSITVNEAKDGKELGPLLQRELDRINRAQAAAGRAGFLGMPAY